MLADHPRDRGLVVKEAGVGKAVARGAVKEDLSARVQIETVDGKAEQGGQSRLSTAAITNVKEMLARVDQPAKVAPQLLAVCRELGKVDGGGQCRQGVFGLLARTKRLFVKSLGKAQTLTQRGRTLLAIGGKELVQTAGGEGGGTPLVPKGKQVGGGGEVGKRQRLAGKKEIVLARQG